ncbi:hypothetical protein K0M31_016061 [Melipona bicolor]|uniref:Uncharacterized protein n=1 Tax=Melipona bicolor TaxID=60889 RepID=A0AA40G7M6_9HYME|nr:hypothetical protein K0M31_016061 [Melipona bicolor]
MPGARPHQTTMPVECGPQWTLLQVRLNGAQRESMHCYAVWTGQRPTDCKNCNPPIRKSNGNKKSSDFCEEVIAKKRRKKKKLRNIRTGKTEEMRKRTSTRRRLKSTAASD